MRQKHLTMYEREVIEVHIRAGRSLRFTSQVLGRAASTISREVERNGLAGGYEAKEAHRKASNRLRAWRRPRRFDDARLVRQVKEGLFRQDSPEQIVGTWPKDLPKVSVHTIYTFVKQDRPQWLRHLRQGRSRFSPSYRQPRKYQRIRDLKPIRQRPAVANERGRVGDWESDTVRGSDRQAGIATHVDRRTGYVVLAKVMNRSAEAYNQATLQAFNRQPVRLPTQTFTVDHGMEFGKFAELEHARKAQVFFAQPHCAWQRGTNENTNGLLRQYFPKTRDFRFISEAEVCRVEARLNMRPRKRHGYRSPFVLMIEAVAFVS